MSVYRVRVRDDAEGGPDDYYRKHRGEFLGYPLTDPYVAEDIARLCGADRFEVVEVDA